MTYDEKQMRARVRSRMKEFNEHLKKMRKNVKDGDVVSARLSAIRLVVWAEAVRDVLGEEVTNLTADRR